MIMNSTARSPPSPPRRRPGSVRPFPIIHHRGFAIALAGQADADPAGFREDGNVMGVVLANQDVAAGLVGVVDQTVPDLLPGREADIVAGLHRIGAVAEAQRQLALED